MYKHQIKFILFSTLLFGGFYLTKLSAQVLEVDKNKPLFSTQCSDHVDNDKDGATDFPADRNCLSFADNTEAPTIAPIAPLNPVEMNFSGTTSPLATVRILRQGLFIASTQADAVGFFEIELLNEPRGNIRYGFIAEDVDRVKTRMITIPAQTRSGESFEFDGLVLPPSVILWLDEEQNRYRVTGYAQPNTQIEVMINSTSMKQNQSIITNQFGGYDTVLESVVVSEQEQFVTVHVTSPLFSENSFALSSQRDATIDFYTPCRLRGDLNNDCLINLSDLSLLRLMSNQLEDAEIKELEHLRLNGDGKIDKLDMAILNYYWTG